MFEKYVSQLLICSCSLQASVVVIVFDWSVLVGSRTSRGILEECLLFRRQEVYRSVVSQSTPMHLHMLQIIGSFLYGDMEE